MSKTTKPANEQENTTPLDPNEEAQKIIEAAKAEAAAIVAKAQAEAENAAKDTANEAVEAVKVNPDDELVPVRLFKDNDKYKDDVFVAVNGEAIQIKRGETVMVKRKFAKVLENQQAQDTKTANLIEQESTAYEEEAKKRGL